MDQDGLSLLLGRRALELGLITAEQLRLTLAEQARLASTGAPSRTLGDLLVERGHLTGSQLADLQQDSERRTLLACPVCSKRFPIAAFDPVKTYRCSACREILTPAPLPNAAGSPDPKAAKPSTEIRLRAERSSPEPETSLGKYTLLRELGRGGMGLVYEALDTELGRKVALKMLMTSPAQNAEQAGQEEERFLRESRLTAQLPKHSHVVGVYEAGVLGGRRYLAMELIEGISMADWRKKSGQTVRQQIAVLYDVALAVHHAHEHGVIHRDLKPQNVLVDSEGRPHVMDFGLAKSAQPDTRLSLTAAGMIVGTPGYMSPEQAQGLRSLDRRTDVYALGIMLYEILTNRMPFEGQTAVDILVKVVKNDVPKPSSVSRMPAPLLHVKELENICLKAAAKLPRDRYPTAQALAEDLGRWLKGERVRVRPPRPTANRRRIYVAVAAVLLGGILAFLYREPSAPDIEPELARADRLMREKNYMDALMAYGQALRKAPASVRARAGQREAYEAVRVAMAQADSQRAKMDSQKAREELDDRKNAAQAAAGAAEREKLIADQKAAEERARAAEEAAKKAKEDLARILAKPQASGAVAPTPPSDAWKGAVNLLALVDPRRDAVAGSWRRQGSSIVSDSAAAARLEIPYQPSKEYDVRMEFSRKEGSDEVVLILLSEGRPFLLRLGRGPSLDLEPTSGRSGGAEANGLPGAPALENGRTYHLLVQVRPGSVAAWLDGSPIVQGRSAGELLMGSAWRLHDSSLLGIGSQHSPTIFGSVELLTVAGQGRAVEKSGQPPGSRPLAAQRTLLGHDSEVKLAALSPDGRTVASAGIDRTVRLWDFASGQERRTLLGHSAMVRFVAFSPDGRLLASAGMDRQIKLWDLGTFQERRTLLGHSNAVRSLAFSPDGGILASGSWDRTIKLWEVSTGKEIRTLTGHTDFVKGIAWSMDGSQLASGSQDGTVRLWDVATGRNLRTFVGHTGSIEMVAFLNGGTTLVSGGHDNLVKVWDLASGRQIRSFQAHDGPIEALGLSPDGRTLATGSWDHTIKLWDTATWRHLKTAGEHNDIVQSVTFTADGRFLMSSSHDGSIRIWDLRSTP